MFKGPHAPNVMRQHHEPAAFNLNSVNQANLHLGGEQLTAIRIADITRRTITLDDEGYEPRQFPQAWMDKHRPAVGGYLILMRNGTFRYMDAQKYAWRHDAIRTAFNASC